MSPCEGPETLTGLRYVEVRTETDATKTRVDLFLVSGPGSPVLRRRSLRVGTWSGLPLADDSLGHKRRLKEVDVGLRDPSVRLIVTIPMEVGSYGPVSR